MKIYGLDIRSLGLFRILLGISILYDLIFNKLLLFNELYDIDGLIGYNFLKNSLHTNSLLGFINLSYYELLFLHIFALIMFLLFTIGYFTKITSVISYILFILITHTYFYTMIGADQIVVAIFTFALFLPLNETFSVDKGFLKSIDKNIEVKGLAITAILIQISFIFFFNSLSKNGDDWINGTAIKYTLIDTIISRRYSHVLFNFKIICFLTYITHFFQLLFLFLIFFPFKNSKIRLFLSLTILAIHWGIYILLDVGYFNIICSSISVLLLPNHFWNYFSKNNEKVITTNQLKKHVKLTLIILLLLITQRNVFNFLNMTILSKTKKFQEIYSYFKPINDISRCFPLISQFWGMFSPNPPHEIGFVTIEGIKKDGKTVNLSQLDPFKNHYKTTTNNVVNKVMLTIRSIYASNHYKNKDSITKEVVEIWENYEWRKIEKKYETNEFLKIDIVFYSCSVEEYLKNGSYHFKKILVKNLKQKS
ncbi:HTTM domain-containing protein [Flavobacterium undicola]|uniref:HTTM domain-containing protein n=1 Tax=Flavobacterium undicola TaxID=1932779 RepID=UPI00137752E5|nr:HTTM domain-containing protein [Flavobacterium undicola]MBA0884767.1 HTTM domain-containing protein [Flavobacterium undicola]